MLSQQSYSVNIQTNLIERERVAGSDYIEHIKCSMKQILQIQVTGTYSAGGMHIHDIHSKAKSNHW